MAEPFRFHQCISLLNSTGRKAADILELLENLKDISPDAIFHHMHQYFLKPHVVPPEFPNDFATWVAEDLGEHRLAEGLANLNPFEFESIEGLRGELVRIISEHIRTYHLPGPVLPGREFFFNESISFVTPTDLTAASLEEFLRVLPDISPPSIYFHFYEARLRLGKKADDFSEYFEQCPGCAHLAQKIKSLDPYMYSTEVLRGKIISLIKEEVYGAS